MNFYHSSLKGQVGLSGEPWRKWTSLPLNPGFCLEIWSTAVFLRAKLLPFLIQTSQLGLCSWLILPVCPAWEALIIPSVFLPPWYENKSPFHPQRPLHLSGTFCAAQFLPSLYLEHPGCFALQEFRGCQIPVCISANIPKYILNIKVKLFCKNWKCYLFYLTVLL